MSEEDRNSPTSAQKRRLFFLGYSDERIKYMMRSQASRIIARAIAEAREYRARQRAEQEAKAKADAIKNAERNRKMRALEYRLLWGEDPPKDPPIPPSPIPPTK